MHNIFGPDGLLKAHITGFENRPSQENMASFIFDGLQKKETIIVEAGTGTGKTLAYLFPAVKYGIENKKKIIISTETKALQKQLIDKDLPVLKQICKNSLNIDFKYSLCLGGANYPCRRRFDFLNQKGLFSKDESADIELLNEKFKKRKIFTRIDTPLSNSIWNEIHREGDACNPFRCYYASSCPYQLARREWGESDLLIMNHYLFITNIASGRTYIPEGEIVIFDEAHSLEEVASSQLGFKLSQDALDEIFSLLVRDTRKGGFLDAVPSAEARKKLHTLVNIASVESSAFFIKALSIIPLEKNAYRITSSISFGGALHKALKDIKMLMLELNDLIPEDDYYKIEFDSCRSKLNSFTDAFGFFIYLGDPNFVYWLERTKKNLIDNVIIFGRPIDVSQIMQDEVFKHYESCVLTSATLAVNGSFNFLCSNIGIKKHSGKIFESPFNYAKQTVLLIPKRIPDPWHADFPAGAGNISIEIINFLNGNCLMLFTSYKNLKELKTFLQDETGFSIYSQDEMPASEAVNQYLNNDGSILMGTHSFWQGIDLPGDLLRGLIMMKLPFSVPDTPLFQAKSERLTKDGKNPFAVLQIPEAVIKFKQGFGRLIRSRKDIGIVAVLDSRIIFKSYGKEFLNAIPKCRVVYTVEDAMSAYEELKQSD